MTYNDHPDDIKISQFLLDRSMEILDAAGAQKKWVDYPAETATFTAHLLGTCRMGKDPKTSVIDPDHRTHDVPNLFVCDTSVFVTSAGVNPTLTAMALASRTADHIAASAKRGELR